ncbi:MAG TPA: VOC family protein [Fimbriimonadaceae bacterium]|nr:VOC family protein [Fimbriimonadaceae bacterium]
MSMRFTHHTIYVTDQEEAKAFYVGKLGFDVNTDAQMGDFRWLTVSPKAQPDFELILMPLVPSPMMDAKTCDQLKELLKSGNMPTGAFHTDDCQATYNELKAKGVEFTSEPKEEVWGLATVMKDPFGNWYSLGQPKR